MSDADATTEAASGAEQWRTNSSLAEIADRLRSSDRVALATHARPDGDAVGSTLALARTLAAMGRKAMPIYNGPWPHRFDPLVGRTQTVRSGLVGEGGSPPLGWEPDAIVVTDTGSWGQLSELRAWLAPRRAKTMVIDHHLHGDAEVAALRVIETGAAAVCEPVSELCVDLLGANGASDLPPEIAEACYVGLATDTGWFRHSNVRPGTLRRAADLLDAGADHTRLFEMVEHNDGPQRVLLMGRAIHSLELHADGRIALMSISQEDMKACGGDQEDAGGMNDLAMQIGTVRVSAMLTELEPGLTKISLRSKAPVLPEHRRINVNEVARRHGGGGHAQAAGLKLHMPLKEASDLIRDDLVDAVAR